MCRLCTQIICKKNPFILLTKIITDCVFKLVNYTQVGSGVWEHALFSDNNLQSAQVVIM